MEIIKITFTEMEQVAKQIADLASKYKEEVNKLRTEASDIEGASYWKGSDKNAFIIRLQSSTLPLVETVCDSIMDASQAINQKSQDYKDAENELGSL